MTVAPCLDEQLFDLSRALRLGRLTDWERGFGLSLLGRAKRGGPDWRPSRAQAAKLREITAAARRRADGSEEAEDDPVLIDCED